MELGRALPLLHPSIAMRRQTTIEQLAKQYDYRLKRCKRHMVWEHRANHQIVVTPMTPSDCRSIDKIEKRFKQGAQLPRPLGLQQQNDCNFP